MRTIIFISLLLLLREENENRSATQKTASIDALLQIAFKKKQTANTQVKLPLSFGIQQKKVIRYN